jgi:hypothetical protein
MGAGLDGTVKALAVAPDGSLYAGGSFTGRIARWNGSAWSVVGGGVSGGSSTVNALAIAPNGNVYVGGVFTAAGSISASNIAVWNGVGWSALGAGTDAAVNALAIAPDGVLHLGGAFGAAGGLPTNGYAEWNGTTFVASDQNGGPVNAILIDDLWVWLGYALGSTGVSETSGVTAINMAASAVNARFRFVGPGRLTSLRNWTTGARMYFDLDLQPGEIVTMTLNVFSQTQPALISSARGNISSRILPTSTPARNFLAAGVNQITAYINGGTGATSASVVWRESYPSLDASVQ